MRRWVGALALASLSIAGHSAAASDDPSVALQSGFAPALEAIGVRDIQLQLKSLGYDPGDATGAMSEATRSAILAYQADYGLPQDGVAGPAVQNALHFLPRRAAPIPVMPSEVPPAVAPIPESESLSPQVEVEPPAVADEAPLPPTDEDAPPPTVDQEPAVDQDLALLTPPRWTDPDAVPPPAPTVPPMVATAVPAAPAVVGPAPAPKPAVVALAIAPTPKPAVVAAIAPVVSPPAIAVPMRVAVPPAGEMIDGLVHDGTVAEAQLCLQRLGYYHGEADGVLNWATVDALIKFDASGQGPTSVIADARRPGSVLLARLKIAAATAH